MIDGHTVAEVFITIVSHFHAVHSGMVVLVTPIKKKGTALGLLHHLALLMQTSWGSSLFKNW